MGREWLAPICQRLGIPFLDLTNPLRELVRSTGKTHIFRSDGHYNEAAHRVAGETMAEWVEGIFASAATQPVRVN